MDAHLDAYVFAADATQSAIDDALDLVTAGTARAVLPMPGDDREVYVAVGDSDATDLLTKLAAVVTIDGLSGVEVHLGIGDGTVNRPFPTHGTVDDYVGFALLATAPGNIVSVFEAVWNVSNVAAAAMVGTGSVTVLVEVTSDSNTTVSSALSSLAALTGVTSSVLVQGPVANGAGFTTS
jgi:hypothetical protein